MPNEKRNSRKGVFSLAPITLSEPVKATDGFTNLVETPAESKKTEVSPQATKKSLAAEEKPLTEKETPANQIVRTDSDGAAESENQKHSKADENQADGDENQADGGEQSEEFFSLTETELLRILDADSISEIYELTDVLRASSLKLYAALVQLADPLGRARVKNHELMSKAGIKGIATLYKQERWLMDLKLLEKKAKPGPHDGSSYVVYKLKSLPLPLEIHEKFDEYLSRIK